MYECSQNDFTQGSLTYKTPKKNYYVMLHYCVIYREILGSQTSTFTYINVFRAFCTYQKKKREQKLNKLCMEWQQTHPKQGVIILHTHTKKNII